MHRIFCPLTVCQNTQNVKVQINRKRIKSKQPYLQQLCAWTLFCTAGVQRASGLLSAGMRADHYQQQGQRSAWAEGMSCFLSTHHSIHRLTQTQIKHQLLLQNLIWMPFALAVARVHCVVTRWNWLHALDSWLLCMITKTCDTTEHVASFHYWRKLLVWCLNLEKAFLFQIYHGLAVCAASIMNSVERRSSKSSRRYLVICRILLDRWWYCRRDWIIIPVCVWTI